MSLALHEIAESGHRILNPFTEHQLLELGAVARIDATTTVLDLACGKGEMLCRWAHEFGASGVGVDISEVFTAAARRRAADLGIADRVRIDHGDASTYQAPAASFDVAACLGATWIGGGVAGTIDLLRTAAKPTGLLLVGEPYWAEPPPPDAYAALGVRPDEFADLPALLARFDASGTDLVEMVLATKHGWDRYVAAQWWNLRQWLDAHPHDTLTTEVRAFLDNSRHAHLAYQRRYLNWGVFVLKPTR